MHTIAAYASATLRPTKRHRCSTRPRKLEKIPKAGVEAYLLLPFVDPLCEDLGSNLFILEYGVSCLRFCQSVKLKPSVILHLRLHTKCCGPWQSTDGSYARVLLNMVQLTTLYCRLLPTYLTRRTIRRYTLLPGDECRRSKFKVLRISLPIQGEDLTARRQSSTIIGPPSEPRRAQPLRPLVLLTKATAEYRTKRPLLGITVDLPLPTKAGCERTSCSAGYLASHQQLRRIAS